MHHRLQVLGLFELKNKEYSERTSKRFVGLSPNLIVKISSLRRQTEDNINFYTSLHYTFLGGAIERETGNL